MALKKYFSTELSATLCVIAAIPDRPWVVGFSACLDCVRQYLLQIVGLILRMLLVFIEDRLCRADH